jgi:hypothetical protein
LNLKVVEIIMRRGGKSGNEIKEKSNGGTSQSIGQYFVNGSSVFLEFGRPALEGEFRIQLSIARATDL